MVMLLNVGLIIWLAAGYYAWGWQCGITKRNSDRWERPPLIVETIFLWILLPYFCISGIVTLFVCAGLNNDVKWRGYPMTARAWRQQAMIRHLEN